MHQQTHGQAAFQRVYTMPSLSDFIDGQAIVNKASRNPHGRMPDMNLLPHVLDDRKSGQPPAPEIKHPRLDKAISFVLRFGAIYTLWMLLSGFFDPFHLSLGAACSAFVVLISADLFPPEVRHFRRIKAVLGMVTYLVWFLGEIVKANVWVFYLVVHPRMGQMIDPVIVRFRSKLRSKLALTLFANSITLTPGTITVSVDERGFFVVHGIDRKSAEGLPGVMEEKIARIFGEG
ncbi:Na+/H+ antiporter subunit E [Desulfocurvibacter africanus]|nr:Na+/H+ antiporter subunit E [Desulfocurvibacter africanus]